MEYFIQYVLFVVKVSLIMKFGNITRFFVLTNAMRYIKKEGRMLKIKTIKPKGKADVYCMNVDKYHNFSVEGGLIIHNCLDALRYVLYSQFGKRKTIRGGMVL